MKRIEKNAAVVLALALAVSLGACGSSSGTTEAATESVAETAAETSAEETKAAETEAASDDVYTLQLAWGTADSEYDPFAIAAHSFAEIVEEKSNGRIKIEFFPNSVLGAERDTFEGISMGTIDMGLINTTPIGSFVPEAQLYDMPYFFPSKDAVWEIADGEVGAMIDQAILDDYGEVTLGCFDGGYRMMYNNAHPINTPEDMKGLTMRSMESKVYLDMYTNLGANPTAMAFTEIFTGLQQNTVDGFEIGMAVYYTNNFQEVTKYMSLTNHTFTCIRLLIGQDKLNSLPEDLQQIIREAAEEAEVASRAENEAKEAEMLGFIADAGVEINEVDTEPFKELCTPIWDDFEGEIGSDIMAAAKEVCGN